MRDSWNQTSESFKAKMIGKLLGDGCITLQKGRKPRFQFMHTYSDYHFTKFCYDHLVGFIPLNPPKYKKTIDPRLVKGYSLSHYVQSKTSSIITYLRSQWYSNTGKVVPRHLINDHFNEQSLAWWFMDDGHLKQKENTPEKIVLSTESFTIQENKWLIHFLHQKYNLCFSLDKQNRIILYDQFQIHYFLYLVMPFLHESMHRKILPLCIIKNNIAARRTTIYLPTSIILDSPTKDINAALIHLSSMIRQYKTGRFYKRYHKGLFNRNVTETESHQIVINSRNLSNLQLLKDLTGLTFSRLAELCFSWRE